MSERMRRIRNLAVGLGVLVTGSAVAAIITDQVLGWIWGWGMATLCFALYSAYEEETEGASDE